MIPRPDARPAPSWLRTRPVAHRGLHDARAPENTLPAFEAAARAGYPIELDVHMLGDGTVVVFHDDDLARATRVARDLSEETGQSIRTHKLFDTEYGIPTLSEVLELVAGRVPVLVEIKNGRSQRGVEQAVYRQIERYHGELAIQSFNPFAVAWFARNAPHVIRGQLAGPLEDHPGLTRVQRFATRHLLTTLWSWPHFVNYDLQALPNAWVQGLARSADVPLLCWTVRNARDKSRADALGVNYVFDAIRP